MSTGIVPPSGRYDIPSVPLGVAAVVTYLLDSTLPFDSKAP
jgi:hypothetical protein